MMSANICIDESLVDVIIDALTKKMDSLNTLYVVMGVGNKEMNKEYKRCVNALDIMLQAKGSINDAMSMVGK